jgi:hypothetical protein
MLDLIDRPHRSADEDKGYCAKAKNGSAQLLSLLRKHHAEVMQGQEPEPVEIEIIEVEPEPVAEPDPIKVWAERQKAIPIKKARWFRVEKDLGPSSCRTIQVEDVIKAVAYHYGISRNDILSPRRDKDVVRPRQLAAYLCKELTSRSLPEIGRRMSRDHTTIIASIKRINLRLAAAQDGLAEDIAEIKREILNDR